MNVSFCNVRLCDIPDHTMSIAGSSVELTTEKTPKAAALRAVGGETDGISNKSAGQRMMKPTNIAIEMAPAFRSWLLLTGGSRSGGGGWGGGNRAIIWCRLREGELEYTDASSTSLSVGRRDVAIDAISSSFGGSSL